MCAISFNIIRDSIPHLQRHKPPNISFLNFLPLYLSPTPAARSALQIERELLSGAGPYRFNRSEMLPKEVRAPNSHHRLLPSSSPSRERFVFVDIPVLRPVLHWHDTVAISPYGLLNFSCRSLSNMAKKTEE